MKKFSALLLAIALLTTQLTFASQTADTAHEQGRDIYNFRCYFCHGYSGNAKTLTSTYVDPKPRDFTKTSLDALSHSKMIKAVTHGISKTAMISFSRVLNDDEIALVVDFVRTEFMKNKLPNTRYHTKENGWDKHERYQIAYPFAKGEIPLDTPWEELTEEQQRGKQFFMVSCITCHDHGVTNDPGITWSSQALSYPRNNFSYSDIDAVTSASIYAIHDIPPDTSGLSAQALLGKTLYEINCAFCHAADGTGENWIGSFLEPKPRNLTTPAYMKAINKVYLKHAINEGLTNTSMPAWKSVLSKEQVDQIITYIDEAFHPIGKSRQ